MSEKGIEINSHSFNRQVTVSPDGIEIKRQGKPITSNITTTGYAYLLVDCSGSMDGDKFSQAKKGTIRFAKEALSKGYSIGVISFSSSANQLAAPTRDFLLLERCVAKMTIGGSTNIAEAISLAYGHLKDRVGNRAMIVVTDGMPDDIEATIKAAERAKQSNIDIIAIGTDDADKVFLKKLASRSDLGIKVNRENFEEGIMSSTNLLGRGK